MNFYRKSLSPSFQNLWLVSVQKFGKIKEALRWKSLKFSYAILLDLFEFTNLTKIYCDFET